MSTTSDIQERKYESHYDAGTCDFWITPVQSTHEHTAEEIVQNLIGERNIYAFSWAARGRRLLKAEDRICFYIAQKGVVGHAKIVSSPQERICDWISHPEKYPWVIDLKDVQLYLDQPISLDATTRNKLEAFNGRENKGNFGWFVRSTRRISQNDFVVLTSRLPG